MNPISIGLWGAFFGCTALAFSVALLAFWRAAPKVAFTTSLAVLLSSAYAIVFLGWVPGVSDATLARLQAMVGIAAAALLCLLLFVLLGIFRTPRGQSRARRTVLVLGVAAVVAVMGSSPREGLELAVGVAFLVAGAATLVSIVSARRGERAGWFTLAGLPCVCIAMAGLDWYALRPLSMPWQAHAASAAGAMGYILCVGVAMWSRYAYLIDVREVVKHGPHFDPVSRMPTYATGVALQTAFSATRGRSVGVVVVSVSNLGMLEQLHGRGAYNHAVFVCASRLRKLGFAGADLIRLPEDSFGVLTPHASDPQQLVDQARRILGRLVRPITLQTSQRPNEELTGTRWEASLGVGVVLDPSESSLDVVITGARAVARTAWSYPSRMAWYDESTNSVSEMPIHD